MRSARLKVSSLSSLKGRHSRMISYCLIVTEQVLSQQTVSFMTSVKQTTWNSFTQIWMGSRGTAGVIYWRPGGGGGEEDEEIEIERSGWVKPYTASSGNLKNRKTQQN